jgi:ABC-type dipeptide/oligopeptide/nickel transport system permease subunit
MSDDMTRGDAQEESLAQLARSELAELAGDWESRADAFDHRDAGAVIAQRSLLRDAIHRFVRNRIAVAASLVMVVFVTLSIFVPLKADWNPLYAKASATTFDFAKANEGPSAEHPFGTDPQGRDLWKRVWQGGRISLAIGLGVALMILIIGVAYGAVSGYVGGRTDSVMMRFLDSLYGLPYLPFAIIMVALVRQFLPNDASPLYYMVPALSLTTWFTAARVTRGQVLSLKQNEYVEAASAQGAPWHRVVRRHLMPNIAGLMVVVIALEIPGAILGEAMLSFLGLGVTPPNTSWGSMAFDGADYFTSYPHLVWAPALLIAITVLCTVAIADGLRDALDPRTQGH